MNKWLLRLQLRQNIHILRSILNADNLLRIILCCFFFRLFGVGSYRWMAGEKMKAKTWAMHTEALGNIITPC